MLTSSITSDLDIGEAASNALRAVCSELEDMSPESVVNHRSESIMRCMFYVLMWSKAGLRICVNL